MPASCAIANDGKNFNGSDRRFAHGLVITTVAPYTPVATIVVVVRSDILQLATNPVTVPATRDTGS